MSTGAPAPRALIRPGFPFTISLVFQFQGFMDSAHISIHLPTLGDLGIILTISPLHHPPHPHLRWHHPHHLTLAPSGSLTIHQSAEMAARKDNTVMCCKEVQAGGENIFCFEKSFAS